MILTLIIATHACMLTSIRSSTPCRYTFDANRTLSYRLRLVKFFILKYFKTFLLRQEPLSLVLNLNDKISKNLTKHKPTASVLTLAPLYFPRKITRPVSYYAFFKGWLLLSQPPGCLSNFTSFST